ncbi:MAG: hypothetical protein ACJA2S_001274 [Cyclobacteriaceae bacterium]|jgi:hypothetical protein
MSRIIKIGSLLSEKLSDISISFNYDKINYA